jgi:hypothetical protein
MRSLDGPTSCPIVSKCEKTARRPPCHRLPRLQISPFLERALVLKFRGGFRICYRDMADNAADNTADSMADNRRWRTAGAVVANRSVVL